MTAPDVVTEMFAAYRTSLDSLEGKLGSAFSDAVDLLEGMSGTVVVCGMGKSGLVGAKITATLTSTGTPSVFLHPAEAMHGDLGIVRKGDVIILISNSGETEEIVSSITRVSFEEYLSIFDLFPMASLNACPSAIATSSIV